MPDTKYAGPNERGEVWQDEYQEARIALRDRYGVEPKTTDVVALMHTISLMPNHSIEAALGALQLAQADTIPDPTPVTLPEDIQPATRYLAGPLINDFGVVVFVKDNDVAGLARLRAHAALDQLLDQHGITR